MTVTAHTQPSGHVIYYDDPDHSYWTGYDEETGQRSGRIPGVSSIAKAGNGDSGSVDGLIQWGINLYRDGVSFKDKRDEAMEVGNAAHKTLELLDEGIQVPETAHCHAVIDWWKQRRPLVMQAEWVVYDHEHGFAGQPDLFFQPAVLLDLKTGSIRPEAFVQLNLYRIAMRVAGYPVPDHLQILDTHDDGTWREIEVPIRPEWATAALSVYRNGKDIGKALRAATKPHAVAPVASV